MYDYSIVFLSPHYKDGWFDGAVNLTLSQYLAKVIDDDQQNWDEQIDTVLMSYLAPRQASTKHPPYCMLYHNI